MLIRRFASLLFISAVPLAAQIVNNTVTVTASQNSTAQPDEAVFSVTVTSVGAGTSLDQIVAAVSGLGITAANLVQITNTGFLVSFSGTPPSSPPVPLNWIFQLVVPFSKLKDTTAALAALQKSISQNNSGLTLSFALSGTRVSAQQAPACNLANLVSQARAQAQDIVSAAGLKAGAVVGLTSAASNGAPLCSLTARFALGAMFGQLEPNAIIITATRTNAIQPDQVLIGLNVQSPTTAGLDDITGALTGAGISGANFMQVSTFLSQTGLQSQTGLVWSFTLTAPLSKLSATLTQLVSAQQTISGNNAGLTLTFYVEGMQISPQLQQSQPCSQATLLADAQAQAKQVAAVAGVTAGAILSMGEGSSGAAGYPINTGITNSFTAVLPGTVAYSNTLLTPTPLSCSLTVQFQLM
jgi:uncharacterized protein YggE